MVAPSGEGGMRCMQMAMDMADRIGGEKKVDYVNTHGTSTPVGDVKELGAIKEVFTAKGCVSAAVARDSAARVRTHSSETLTLPPPP